MVLEGYSQTDIGLFTYLLNRRIQITEDEVKKFLQITPVILEEDFWAKYDKLNTQDKTILNNLDLPDKQPTFQDSIQLLRVIGRRVPRIGNYFIRNPNRLHDLASYIYRNWKNLSLIKDLPEETHEPEEVEETPGIETIGATSHKPEEEYLA
jgi:hypothetical protein